MASREQKDVHWSVEEVAFLVEHFGKMSQRQIGLGLLKVRQTGRGPRTPASIARKVRQLKLGPSPLYRGPPVTNKLASAKPPPPEPKPEPPPPPEPPPAPPPPPPEPRDPITGMTRAEWLEACHWEPGDPQLWKRPGQPSAVL